MKLRKYTFDQFLQPDGTYLMPDGSTHSSPQDLLASMLGFCGCGAPEQALIFTRDAIKLLVLDLAALRDEMPEQWDNDLWQTKYKPWHERVRKLFPTTGAEYFFLYWLDAGGLAEHGSNVSGCWLTDIGHALYEDLDLFCDQLAFANGNNNDNNNANQK